MLTEEHVGATAESTLDDLRERLVAVYLERLRQFISTQVSS